MNLLLLIRKLKIADYFLVEKSTDEVVNATIIIKQDGLEMTSEKQKEQNVDGTEGAAEKQEELDGDGKAVSYPCNCRDGQCSCCTGNVLQNFNFNVRNRLCTNLTYDSEDTTIGVKLAFNDFMIYKNKISGKSPKVCCHSHLNVVICIYPITI